VPAAAADNDDDDDDIVKYALWSLPHCKCLSGS